MYTVEQDSKGRWEPVRILLETGFPPKYLTSPDYFAFRKDAVVECEKRNKKVEKASEWVEGTVQEFLSLSDEEMAAVEKQVEARKQLTQHRTWLKLLLNPILRLLGYSIISNFSEGGQET